MKTLILCGGRGIIDPETRQRIPKALIQIGGKPLIWHVMKIFSTAGYNDFILALGEGGDAIRRHFYYQHIEGKDVEFDAGSGQIEYLNAGSEDSWRIKCVDTGLNAQTGGRIARCRRYLENEPFFTTYSDCLCDVKLNELLNFHNYHGKSITVTGVQATSRFGTFDLKDDGITNYTSDTKFASGDRYLNGGFMVMNPSIFRYLDVLSECNLEQTVFSDLTKDNQLMVHRHNGYWQSVDAERDIDKITHLYMENRRPWLPI
jgi:glucose-1-phosphate cytidylyltransferase